ncbi:hypothetical protein DPMN_077697 [Dreissena polymorpha]|uniref:Uncharacterized protein n=1 Tax=Dreissena polymorpha TaxID=45954 RepID=A0A9D3YQH4_DREPO|nr:hypothetical protein DPMN_077697 [Dreissena polymorpha]
MVDVSSSVVVVTMVDVSSSVVVGKLVVIESLIVVAGARQTPPGTMVERGRLALFQI